MQRIRDALREVDAPEIGISVVDPGLARKVEGQEGKVYIKTILDAPFCPVAEMVMERAQAAAQTVTDRTVRAALGSEQWDPSMMAHSAQQRFGPG